MKFFAALFQAFPAYQPCPRPFLSPLLSTMSEGACVDRSLMLCPMAVDGLNPLHQENCKFAFPAEQAGKAGISGQKRRKQVTVKQGPFLKSIMA
jgi:hypothetical protein